MEENKELKGLGGWLILVGIGVTLGPLRMIAEYVPMFYAIFSDGTYEALTTPGSEFYNVLWGPFLIFELVVNSIIVFASLLLMYLYYAKHYFFPKLYIMIILFSLVFILLDAWLGSFVLIDEPMFDTSILTELFRTVVTALIWIPYMLISVRVKNTFVVGKTITKEVDDDPIVA